MPTIAGQGRRSSPTSPPDIDRTGFEHGFDDPLSLDELAERVLVLHEVTDTEFGIDHLSLDRIKRLQRAHLALAVLKPEPRRAGTRLLRVIKNRYPTLRGSPLWPALKYSFPSLGIPEIVVPNRLEERIDNMVAVDAADYAVMRLVW